MTRDPRYDVLFEPIEIGPVTAPNRFYQVPHCNGMGRVNPTAMAHMRGMKAEGGWGIVATEQCDIHHTADIAPYTETRLWDDGDKPYLARMAEAVKAHGSLAAIELVHNGIAAGNLYSREVPIGPMHRPIKGTYTPVQARAMDLSDIRDYRRWHRNTAIRARDAGFDIIVVYAGHDGTMPAFFLSKRHNQRSDEYGGSLENRLRLFRELIEETKDAVGGTMGVVVRFAVDEMMGPDGMEWANEGRDAVEMLAELPDMWDVNVSDWANDSMTSRFAEEGYQEEFISFVKQVTTKPVATVGRYTSPDAMVSAIRRGVVDIIGAARPSIADPFLPKKIEEGRIEDIRECIGCNICAAWNNMGAPLRCTQNPTQGEEWRKGWHPEKIATKGSDASVLVVGAGPAGLEAARALGQRGYHVTLAEAGDALGGRVTLESALPGLSAWARVRDYRLGQIREMANVEVFMASKMTAELVRELGADHVAIATGSKWRPDGMGRANLFPVPGADGTRVLTPDDIMAGRRPDGPSGSPVIVYDDDHYYMGSVIAELLRGAGHEVTLATPGLCVAEWTQYTLEQEKIERRMIDLGIEILARHRLSKVGDGTVDMVDTLTRTTVTRSATVISVTGRLPCDELFYALAADNDFQSVKRIGDCYGPATIAHAVYEGHRYARELDTVVDPDVVPFHRERYDLDSV